MNYVGGFVAAVPTAKREVFLKHASSCAAVLKEFGALTVVDCWGDDVPGGKVTSFPMAVKLEPGETVTFLWITWSSRAVRDGGMKKFIADPRIQSDVNPMPFDGKRMLLGWFQVISDM